MSWVATAGERSGGPSLACHWSVLRHLQRISGFPGPHVYSWPQGRRLAQGAMGTESTLWKFRYIFTKKVVCTSTLPCFSPCKHLFSFKKSLGNGWWCCSQVIVAKPAPGLAHYKVMMALHLLVCYSIIVLLSESAYWPEQNIIVSPFNFQFFKSISPLNWLSPIMIVFFIDFPGNISVWK